MSNTVPGVPGEFSQTRTRLSALHLDDAPRGPIVTRTGIVIGGAYQRPPEAMSDDAERIQALLLPACRCSVQAPVCPAPDACHLPEPRQPVLVRWVRRLIAR